MKVPETHRLSRLETRLLHFLQGETSRPDILYQRLWRRMDEIRKGTKGVRRETLK